MRGLKAQPFALNTCEFSVLMQAVRASENESSVVERSAGVTAGWWVGHFG